jgi:predicted hotdog family 3-hydroxylacyl-ACP dehydratase
LKCAATPTDTVARSDIARLIPHQGAMCLLAGVVAWDDETIVCRADNHRDAAHPLRTRHGLLASCLIEYAAQAMALHGALRSKANAAAAQPGMLAAARDVRLALLTLDDLPRADPDELRIEARREAGDSHQLVYAFAARHAGALLGAGRVVVVLKRAIPAR